MRLSYSKPPIHHLSASAIAQLTTCPEQFRLRRILRIPESRGASAFVGVVDHATLEDALRFKLRSGCDYDLTSIPRVYNQAWDAEILDEGEPEWYGENSSDIHDNGELMAVMYHDTITPTINPLAVEERFEQDISGVPVPIVGYADVVEHSRIIEKKTSKSRVRVPKPQWLLQGRIYQLSYDDKPVEYHVSTRQKTPQILTPDLETGLRLEKSNRDGTARTIKQAWDMLSFYWSKYGRDKEWPTHGTQHPFACGYCGFGPKYGDICIAWK